MPLPNAILFPQALLPLYIFEDRYRKMLADCLDGDRMFSVALLHKNPEQQSREPEPYQVAGLGMIRVAVKNDDGTSHIILQGVARIRICGYLKQRPYRIAQIEPLRTRAASASAGPLTEKVSELLDARARLDMALPDHVVKYLTTMKDADNLADLVTFTLISDFYAKQEILETLDLRLRLRRLIELLEKEQQQLLCWKKVQGKTKDMGLN